MSHSHKFPSLIALFSFSLLSLACGARHDTDEHYIFVAANLQVPYWQTAGAGFTKAAMQLRVRADFVGPEIYDPKAERQAFEDAVAKKPTGILVAVVDPAMMKDPIDRAIAAGIPVLTLDSDAPDSRRLFFIGTNNYQAGVTGGRRLAQELKDKGNVVVFTMPEQTNLADRLRGYRDALAAHPGIKIDRVIDIKGDPRVAFDTTTLILGTEKNKIDGFVCLEAQAGKEVALVLNNYTVHDKVVMAMDTDGDTLDWIQKGVIAATIAQKPYTMSFVGLHLLDDLYHYKPTPLASDWARNSFAPVPAFVDTGTALIDKTNVDAFKQEKTSATGTAK